MASPTSARFLKGFQGRLALGALEASQPSSRLGFQKPEEDVNF